MHGYVQPTGIGISISYVLVFPDIVYKCIIHPCRLSYIQNFFAGRPGARVPYLHVQLLPPPDAWKTHVGDFVPWSNMYDIVNR